MQTFPCIYSRYRFAYTRSTIARHRFIYTDSMSCISVPSHRKVHDDRSTLHEFCGPRTRICRRNHLVIACLPTHCQQTILRNELSPKKFPSSMSRADSLLASRMRNESSYANTRRAVVPAILGLVRTTNYLALAHRFDITSGNL